MLKLDDDVRGRMARLRSGREYEDLVDIGAKLCEESERSLLKMNRAAGDTTEAIVSMQEQCRAGRSFLERLLAEIELQARAVAEEQKIGKQEAGGKEPGTQAMETNEQILGLDQIVEAAEMLGFDPSEVAQI
jgi:hypothetical protein